MSDCGKQDLPLQDDLSACQLSSPGTPGGYQDVVQDTVEAESIAEVGFRTLLVARTLCAV